MRGGARVLCRCRGTMTTSSSSCEACHKRVGAEVFRRTHAVCAWHDNLADHIDREHIIPTESARESGVGSGRWEVPKPVPGAERVRRRPSCMCRRSNQHAMMIQIAQPVWLYAVKQSNRCVFSLQLSSPGRVPSWTAAAHRLCSTSAAGAPTFAHWRSSCQRTSRHLTKPPTFLVV